MSNPAVRLAWSEFVLNLADLLKAHEVETPLYLVGGAVRDAYLRRQIKDIDIAVDGDAIGLARRVTDWLDGDIYVMDRERGVARVFVGSDNDTICVDFARFRGASLDDDLGDRDFTMNAMAADLLGEPEDLVDPLGGAADLRLKVLRRCSATAIADDPIRALRAVRLSAQFDLKIHPDTAADIRRHASGLTAASRERIRDEFFKLLGLDRAGRGLRVLQHLDVLRHIVAPVDGLVGVKQAPHAVDAWAQTLAVVQRMTAIIMAISSRRTDNTAAAFDLGVLVIQFDRYRAALQQHIGQAFGNGRSQGELLILAALLQDVGRRVNSDESVADADDVAESVARSLRLTAEEGRKLTTAIGNYERIIEGKSWSMLEQHRFWHQLGASGIDAILLGAAQVLGTRGRALKQRDWLLLIEDITILLDTYFNRYDDVVNPELLLNGNDVMHLLGIRSGPLVGDLLAALREAQATGEIENVSEARDFILCRADSLEN